jgi:hypothetical protein
LGLELFAIYLSIIKPDIVSSSLANADYFIGLLGEMLPRRLFLILRMIRNTADNSRVANAIGTTVAMTIVLLLFLFSDLHAEAPLLHRVGLFSVLSLEENDLDQLNLKETTWKYTSIIQVVGVIKLFS